MKKYKNKRMELIGEILCDAEGESRNKEWHWLARWLPLRMTMTHAHRERKREISFWFEQQRREEEGTELTKETDVCDGGSRVTESGW